jgi:hypothetical protein
VFLSENVVISCSFIEHVFNLLDLRVFVIISSCCFLKLVAIGFISKLLEFFG